MRVAEANGIHIHYADEGRHDGYPVVFSNSLGSDFRLWDRVCALMPEGLRLIRYDKRGHGLSSCPNGPYTISQLTEDCTALLEALGVRECFFVGLSIGGLTAQELALKRPDLVKAVVLSNTGARIGDPEMWKSRIEAARSGKLPELSDSVLERWFSAEFRRRRPDELEGWRAMLTRTPAEGYASCCEAIMSADFRDSVGSIGVPALLIGGTEDGATPADLVRRTATLIPNSTVRIIDGAGHLPCVDSAEEYASQLKDFMGEAGIDFGPG